MSSPQPSSASRRRTEQAIRRAETSGGHGPVVDAIKVVHEELSADIAVLKSDVAVLKSDVAVLKSNVARIDANVEKLLHHFGIVSGGTP